MMFSDRKAHLFEIKRRSENLFVFGFYWVDEVAMDKTTHCYRYEQIKQTYERIIQTAIFHIHTGW